MKMLKKVSGVYFLPFILLMSMGLYSCKKCRTCRYVAGNEIHSSEEFCGDKEEVEDFKDEWQQRADSAGAELDCF